jgi:hypothetical protein
MSRQASKRIKIDNQQAKPTAYGRLVGKSKLEKFKTSLFDFEIEINKLFSQLVDCEQIVYEKCSDLMRIIQLSAETKIAEIKVDNRFHINDEESALSAECKALVGKIQERNEILIEKVDLVEKETKQKLIENESRRKETEKELKLIQAKIAECKEHIQKNGGIDQATLKQANKDFENFITENLTTKVNELSLKQYEISFVPFGSVISEENFKVEHWYTDETKVKSDNDLGHLKVAKTITMNNINAIDCAQLSKCIGHKWSIHSVSINIFPNGNYFVCYFISHHGSKKKGIFELAIYSPTEVCILKRKEFSQQIDQFKIVSNKLVIASSLKQTKQLTIFDDNLNIIQTIEIDFTNVLVGANNSFIYCVDSSNAIIRYDWSFNKVASKEINFIKELKSSRGGGGGGGGEEEEDFDRYETQHEFKIQQFEELNSRFVLRTTCKKSSCRNHTMLVVFDQNVKVLNKTKVCIYLNSGF